MNESEIPAGQVRLLLRAAVRDYLLAQENVVAVDYGLPEKAGQILENHRALRVHVREKLPRPGLEALGITPVPDRIGDLETDVLEATYRPQLWWGAPTVRPAADPRLTRADPLRGGISVSDERHHRAGTLGGKVIDRKTGAEMILANWHVLAGDWIAQPGQRIYQSGRLDGGTAADTVATLTRDAMSSGLDAAVAALNGSRRLVNDQLGVGPVRGVGTATIGMEVVKSGRTTGVTRGRVTGVEGVAQISYEGVRRLIRQVVTISPLWGGEVSRPGDSSSLWLARESAHAVGIHFAGSDVPERALANDIQSVLAALNVDLDVSATAGAARPSSSMVDLLLAEIRRRAAVYA
jgi:endonuclease G